MGEDPAFEALLGTIYDAPLMPHGWQAATASIVAAVGGTAGVLFFQDRSAAQATETIAMTGYAPGADALYNAHYARLDDRLGQLLAAGTGAVMGDGWNIDHGAFRRTELFHDFYRSFGLDAGMGVKLFGDGSRTGVFSAFRALGQEVWTEREVRLLERLGPHLRRALQLKRQLDRAVATADALSAGLDRFPQGVILLDGAGRPMRMNAAAEQLLRDPACPLSVKGEQLRAALPADAAALARTVAEAAAGLRGGADQPPAVLRLRPLAGGLPLGVMAVPLRRAELLGGPGVPGVLVFLSGGPGARVDPAVLAGQFGLSASEAQVAALLCMGEDVTTISDRRAVSRDTVRAQVKSVLAKTGLNSQAKLVALLGRSLGSLRRF